ncbi:hypothetical protein H6762_01555 [Candidatus Nomurabacteria bacterium]|uniref:Uncharacterized protein n=1 Tax=Candidatus Dojkabacteria bacterium TaxID=2099670 RepID=A0A955KYE3_9BACT|nr:hypothetical protein [Candidatus Dojkabacteria bacterium]MCB9789663.1 hypothetical protein [Candidatus Nomurabacteria bacterium]
MVKREIKRQLQRYGTYLEPFELLLLIGIFVIPIMTLFNLTPQYGSPDVPPDNVLGVSTDGHVRIQDIGGSHEFITNERLLGIDTSSYHYYTTLINRESGIYAKPILQVTNPTDSDIEITFSVKYSVEQSSQIGILKDNTNYIIKDKEGFTFPRSFTVASGESAIFSIDVRNDVNINYSEELGLLILSR